MTPQTSPTSQTSPSSPTSSSPQSAAGPRGRVARAVTTRPRLLLLLILLLTAGAVVVGGGVAERMSSGGSQIPGSESSYATAELERRWPASQPNLLLLVSPRDGSRDVDDPAVASAARDLARQLADEKAVLGVVSYWQAEDTALRARDGGEALITARIKGDEDAVDDALEALEPRYQGTHGAVDVRLGGPAAVRHASQEVIADDLVRAEVIALPVTLVLLVVVFGSAVAAALPLLVGIVSVLGTNAVLRVITEFTDVSVYAQNLTTALGLGLAIDYALFLVRRHREELAAGRDPRDAVAVTLRTAGRTVLYSALTVAVCLASMLVFEQYFLRSLAYAGIAVVLISAAASLIALPAALVLLGHRVNALRLPVGRRGRNPGAGWARLARLVMRRAPLFAVGTVAVLLALGLPFKDVRFGTADDRQLPSSTEARVVQEELRNEFPGSPGSALAVLVEGPPAAKALAEYSGEVSRLAHVVQVAGPAGRFVDGKRVDGKRVDGKRVGGKRVGDAPPAVGYVSVLHSAESASPQSVSLVKKIRSVPAPFETSVTGPAAVLADTQHGTAERLPWALAVIAVTTLILVFLLTGSVLLPLLTVVVNGLSLTAMFGAVVWVFQDGHLSGPLGFTPTGDIETALPVLMFCVAFGLSMDYGVFLVSRIKEEYELGGDHRDAVVLGIRRTGGLITAAALILAVVMVAIGTSRVTNIKMLGLGVGLAVLMDAMVVRALLVPAVLRLTGRATWWAPAPLRRLQRRVGLEEEARTTYPDIPTRTERPVSGRT
ncbi:MMPL family transporter [Streptomyces phaeochromogenes]|uniref:MMPL family transporter n=1 Tax=Streptomyces phaeochromogenes TaxID=1923 RepID=A0ABZ1HP91_STRPH|nr:MMPL family transporter [Streptomyces phaeochromogenes]WSD19043.1 MMPL family transporter [Streptomyces phaeochromogenes]